MPATLSGTAVELNALDAAITHVSAHTAAPGDAGANEVTGGSYARQSASFAAAVARAINSDTIPVLSIPGGVTVTHIAFWDALSGGNCLYEAALPSSETDAADWLLRINSARIAL